MSFKKFLLTVLLCSFGVFLVGCGKSLSFIKSDPDTMDIVITSSVDVNPDGRGEASPIVVLLYELKTPSNFESAAFSNLYADESQVLGDDLLHREKFHLPVSGQATYKTEISSDTHFLAVVAAYRNLNHSSWKAYVPIVSGENIKLLIRVDRSVVSIKSR